MISSNRFGDLLKDYVYWYLATLEVTHSPQGDEGEKVKIHISGLVLWVKTLEYHRQLLKV